MPSSLSGWFFIHKFGFTGIFSGHDKNSLFKAWS
jgi:hypothetical protein